MIKIRIDFDDVLNDLCNFWMERHFEATGENIKATTWNVHEISEYGEEVYKYFEEDNFWTAVPVKKGAISMMKWICDSPYFDYDIVSSCSDDSMSYWVFTQKSEWLQKNMPFVDRSKLHIVGNDKSKFDADIFVDDKPENIIDVSHKNGLRLLMTSDHNKQIRIKDFAEDHGVHALRVEDCNHVKDLLTKVLLHGGVDGYIEMTS